MGEGEDESGLRRTGFERLAIDSPQAMAVTVQGHCRRGVLAGFDNPMKGQ